MLKIRHSRKEDLEEIQRLFIVARNYMKENGNPTQWKDTRPDIRLVEKDIELGNSYVIEDEQGITGTFAYIPGIEPTYLQIDGAWLDDEPYGTIHRIASDGRNKGIFDAAIAFAAKQGRDIRIDTHGDNRVMQNMLRKLGFIHCGTIHVLEDDYPRLAFEKSDSINDPS